MRTNRKRNVMVLVLLSPHRHSLYFTLGWPLHSNLYFSTSPLKPLSVTQIFTFHTQPHAHTHARTHTHTDTHVSGMRWGHSSVKQRCLLPRVGCGRRKGGVMRWSLHGRYVRGTCDTYSNTGTYVQTYMFWGPHSHVNFQWKCKPEWRHTWLKMYWYQSAFTMAIKLHIIGNYCSLSHIRSIAGVQSVWNDLRNVPETH